MTILIIGTALLGAILGLFLKVLVLIPACAVTLAMVGASFAYFGQSLPRALLEFAVLITSLQTGYAFGLFSSFIRSACQRRGPRAGRSSLPAPTIGAARRR